MENIFEQATRNKVRFTYKGLLTVEDLWDLPIDALDAIYKDLRSKAKAAQEESLLSKPSKDTEKLLLQIEIVKYIFNEKQEEAAQRAVAAENRKKKARLMEIIANKQDAALADKPVDELLKMLGEIE